MILYTLVAISFAVRAKTVFTFGVEEIIKALDIEFFKSDFFKEVPRGSQMEADMQVKKDPLGRMFMGDWNRAQVRLSEKYKNQSEEDSDMEVVIVTEKWEVNEKLLKGIFLDMMQRVGQTNFYTVYDLLEQKVEEVANRDVAVWMMNEFCEFWRDEQGVYVHEKVLVYKPEERKKQLARIINGEPEPIEEDSDETNSTEENKENEDSENEEEDEKERKKKEEKKETFQFEYRNKYTEFYKHFNILDKNIIIPEDAVIIRDLCGRGQIMKELRGVVQRLCRFNLMLLSSALLTTEYVPQFIVLSVVKFSLDQILDFDDLFFLEMLRRNPSEFPKKVFDRVKESRKIPTKVPLFSDPPPIQPQKNEQPEKIRMEREERPNMTKENQEFLEDRFGAGKDSKKKGWMRVPNLFRNFFRPENRTEPFKLTEGQEEEIRAAIERRKVKKVLRESEWETFKRTVANESEDGGQAEFGENAEQRTEAREIEENHERGKFSEQGSRTEFSGTNKLEMESQSNQTNKVKVREYQHSKQSSDEKNGATCVKLSEVKFFKSYLKRHFDIFFFKHYKELFNRREFEYDSIQDSIFCMKMRSKYFIDILQEMFGVENVELYLKF